MLDFLDIRFDRAYERVLDLSQGIPWARIDADGHWYILGRSDDTLKVAGKKVGPAEIESILVSHPDIQEAAVVGIPHDLKGTCP